MALLLFYFCHSKWKLKYSTLLRNAVFQFTCVMNTILEGKGQIYLMKCKSSLSRSLNLQTSRFDSLFQVWHFTNTDVLVNNMLCDIWKCSSSTDLDCTRTIQHDLGHFKKLRFSWQWIIEPYVKYCSWKTTHAALLIIHFLNINHFDFPPKSPKAHHHFLVMPD